MGDETLLSDLCSICNTTKSKYRCPGCAARTCSLPCYKRHQQWAQCTGKRDPARYVKKSQLATPAGIDHDFNFLTSLERNLEIAERHVSSTALGNAPSDLQREPRRREIGDGGFAAVGVNVIRAPKGLSRQKENKTHRNSRGKIIWTVEWIHSDKSRALSGVSAIVPIEEAYHNLIGKPLSKAGQKRKRGHPPRSSVKPEEIQDAQDPTVDEVGSTGLPAQGEKPEPAPPGRPRSSDQPGNVAGGSQPDPDHEVADNVRPSHDIDGPDSEPIFCQRHFYLLRPRSSSDRHVIIPLSSNATLGDCLRGQTVLEFPTIYVFSGALPQLPEEFMLEEDYLKEEGEDQKEFQALMREVNPESLQAIEDEDGSRTDHKGEELDSVRILDVLKQDLGGAI